MCHITIDSFITYMKTNDVKQIFDSPSYESERPSPVGKNKIIDRISER